TGRRISQTVFRKSLPARNPLMLSRWRKSRNRRNSADLFDELYVDWRVDIAFVTSVLQEFPNRRAPDLAVITGEFVHIHPDDFASQIDVHVSLVRKPVAHRFVPMAHTIINAFADDHELIMLQR